MIDVEDAVANVIAYALLSLFVLVPLFIVASMLRYLVWALSSEPTGRKWPATPQPDHHFGRQVRLNGARQQGPFGFGGSNVPVRLTVDEQWVRLEQRWLPIVGVPRLARWQACWIDRAAVTAVVVSPVPKRWDRFFSMGGALGRPFSYVRFATVDGRYDPFVVWVIDPERVLWALHGFGWPVEHRDTPEVIDRRSGPVS